MKGAVFLISVIALAAGGCTAGSPVTTQPSPVSTGGRSCPGYGSATVLGEFTMPHAYSYRDYLPKMGITPELDRDPAPAYIVVFEGPVSTYSGVESNVVCVVQGDGTVNEYSDVSHEGMSLPGSLQPGGSPGQG
jgi:hypothetical protein